MSRLTKYGGLAVLVAIVGALTISSVVFAQSPTPVAPKAHQANFGGFGGRGMCGQAGLDAAAKALNMTSQDLSAQLWGGRNLADLADKAGVQLTDVQSAVQAACTQATKDAIQQAVTDGKMTQAQADWLIEGIDKGYIGGKGGFGFGMGFGMMGHGRAFGRFGAPNGRTPNGKAPNGAAPNNNGTTTPSRYRF